MKLSKLTLAPIMMFLFFGTSPDAFGQSASDEAIVAVVPKSEIEAIRKACHDSHSLEDCLQEQFNENIRKNGTSNEKLNQEVSSAPQQSLAQGFKLDAITGHFKNLYIMQTFEMGRRIFNEEDVDLDPNKRSFEDQMVGKPGVWLQHWLKVDPHFGIGFRSQKIGPFDTMNKELNIGVDRDFVIRVTKRHLIDGGLVRDQLHRAEEAAKDIAHNERLVFALPGSKVDFGKFNPGEGIEIERYTEYHFEVGPFLRLISESLTSMLMPGVVGIASVQNSHITAHFRTTAEVQPDGLIRVTLEKIKQDKKGFTGAIKVGLIGGLVNYAKNLANFEVSKTKVHDLLLDLVFDPENPKALEALKEAYRGNFIPAEELAKDSFNNIDSGVRLTSKQAASIDHRKHVTKVLVWGSGQDHIEREDHTLFYGADGKISATENHLAEIRKDTESLRGAKRLDVTTTTDMGKTRANGAFAFRYDQRQKSLSLDVIKQFKAFVETFGTLNAQSQLVEFNLEAYQNHSFTGHLVMDLDSVSTAELFDQIVKDEKRFIGAWAQIVGVPDPQVFANLNPIDREQFVSKDPQLKEHYKNFVKFMKSLTEISQNSGKRDKTRTFAEVLGEINYDLFPVISSGSLLDSSHIRTYFRMQVDAKKPTSKILTFNNRGAIYAPPRGVIRDSF